MAPGYLLTPQEIDMELIDLGDAMEETKQIYPIQVVPDALFGWGMWA